MSLCGVGGMAGTTTKKRTWGQRGPGKKFVDETIKEQKEATPVSNINNLSLVVNDYFLNSLNRPADMAKVVEYLKHYSKTIEQDSLVMGHGGPGGGGNAGEEGHMLVGIGGDLVGEGGAGVGDVVQTQGENGEVLANKKNCAFCTMAHRSATGGLRYASGERKRRRVAPLADDDEGLGFDDDVVVCTDEKSDESDEDVMQSHRQGGACSDDGRVRGARFFAQKYNLSHRLSKPVTLVTAFARRVPLIPVGVGALWLFIKDIFQLTMPDALAVDPDSLVRHFYMEGCVARASKCMAVAMKETLLQELYVIKHRGFGSEGAEEMISQLSNAVQGFMKTAMSVGGGGCLHVTSCTGGGGEKKDGEEKNTLCVLANTGVVPVCLQSEPFLSADMRLYVDTEYLKIRNYDLYTRRKNDFSMQPCFVTHKTLSLLRRPPTPRGRQSKKKTQGRSSSSSVCPLGKVNIAHEHEEDDQMQSMFTNLTQRQDSGNSESESDHAVSEEEEKRRQEEVRKQRKRQKAATRSRLNRQRMRLSICQPELYRKTLPLSLTQMKREYEKRWWAVKVELTQLYEVYISAKDRIYPQLMEGVIDIEHCLFCTLSLHPVMRWCLLDLIHMARGEAAKSEGFYDDDDDDDHTDDEDFEDVDGEGGGDSATQLPPLVCEGLTLDLNNLNVNAHQVSVVLERWMNSKYPPLGRLFGEWGLLPTAAQGPWHTDNEDNFALREELVRKLVSHGSSNQKIMCSMTTRRLLWETEPFYHHATKVSLGPPYDCSAHLAAQGATLCISQDSVKSITLLNSGFLNRLLTEHRLSPAWTTKLSLKLRTLHGDGGGGGRA